MCGQGRNLLAPQLTHLVGERESDQMLQFMFTSNFQQSSEKGQDEEVVRKRWRIESLVTRVPRHLQVDKAFTIMSRPTVKVGGTIVHNATNLLGELVA